MMCVQSDTRTHWLTLAQIYADKPWAWSPLISTMNRLAISKGETRWKSTQAEEDVTPLFEDNTDMEYLKENSDARRKYFADQTHRDMVLSKDVRFALLQNAPEVLTMTLTDELRNGLLQWLVSRERLPRVDVSDERAASTSISYL